MSNVPPSHPSFSPGRKWGIGLHVAFLLVVVFSVVVMANYLSRDYFARFHVSTHTRLELAPRTVSFLRSITNQVRVTLYYDKTEPLYSTILDLLSEFQAVNSRISVQTVDYTRDVGAAEKIKAEYKFSTATEKNLVIFDCEGRVKPVPGTALEDVVLDRDPTSKDNDYRRKPVAFKGEVIFTSCLLAITSPKPLKAYFLTGHGEGRPDSDDDQTGYRKFAAVLAENYIQCALLSLLGTNTVPADCNLLVIPGPTDPFMDSEIDKVEQYLNQGGRLLAMFNFIPAKQGADTGLERLLAKWGIEVNNNIIQDPEHCKDVRLHSDLFVMHFGRHPVVNPLLLSRVQMVLPRSVGQLKSRAQAADAPHVDEIAFTEPSAFVVTAPALRKSFPLMVAAEKGAINGVITERGTTRIIVTGDSIFLANQMIVSAANREFAGFAVNWLLDRTDLMQGIAPRPVREFKLNMTKSEMQSAQLLLLGGMPAGVLFLGGLVWLRRRR